MEIHIQDGHPFRAAVEQILGRNRSIIEKTVSAEHVPRRMMSRRATQSKNSGFPCGKGFGAGQRHIFGSHRRFEGPLRDGGFGCQRIVAQFPFYKPGRPALHPSCRPDRCHCLTGVSGLAPLLPGSLKKSHKVGVMDPKHRIHGKGLRCLNRSELDIAHCLNNHISTRRTFKRLYQLAAI